MNPMKFNWISVAFIESFNAAESVLNLCSKGIFVESYPWLIESLESWIFTAICLLCRFCPVLRTSFCFRYVSIYDTSRSIFSFTVSFLGRIHMKIKRVDEMQDWFIVVVFVDWIFDRFDMQLQSRYACWTHVQLHTNFWNEDYLLSIYHAIFPSSSCIDLCRYGTSQWCTSMQHWCCQCTESTFASIT